jgi:hypothetical protein
LNATVAPRSRSNIVPNSRKAAFRLDAAETVRTPPASPFEPDPQAGPVRTTMMVATASKAAECLPRMYCSLHVGNKRTY